MKLSPNEDALLSFMLHAGLDSDVPLSDLFRCLLAAQGNPDPDSIGSTMQQYVGAYVSRINRKQDDYSIIPGELKRTYRVQLKEKNTNA